MSKRKRSSSDKPTKKQRIDTVTLINQLQDDDEDRTIELEESDATKAVDLAYKEDRLQIKREFRTLNPERVLPKRRLQLEQRLEYEDTKRIDRLTEIQANTVNKTDKLTQKRAVRQERQELDEKIEECLDMPEFSDASWQLIGKFRCTTRRLAEHEMSDEQKDRFNDVLKELAEKGWRTKQSTKDIKAATSSARKTDRAAEVRWIRTCRTIHPPVVVALFTAVAEQCTC